MIDMPHRNPFTQEKKMSEMNRAYEIVGELADPDMDYYEMFSLLTCNGISDTIADHVCLDCGRQPQVLIHT